LTISIDTLFTVCKVLLSVSLFYVWVVRYENIKKEFVDYKLPTWLRDLVGILKLSFSLMIISSDKNLVWIGSMGIIVLMIGALATHFKVKNPFQKMIPAVTLSILCLMIIYFNNTI
tara:strand:+ start:130 stop:477 length:348 start_codon:yes stop_codon:yes gene_type:complete